MGENTAIAWCDHTFNTHWGCERVSPGCQNCYAETFAKRTGNDVWGKNNGRRFFGDKHWNEPVRWDRAAEKAGRPALVFCASMGDVFEDRRDLDVVRERLWELIAYTPHLIWQLLTKRPQNVRRLAPDGWFDGEPGAWPEQVWIGTTVEDQERAYERIPHLLNIPAQVRFLSCEPLLGSVDLSPWLATVEPCPTCEGSMSVPVPGGGMACPDCLDDISGQGARTTQEVQWVIVGGESGPKHRPMDLAHAQTIVLNCKDWGVPVFFKQVGGRTPTAGGDELDGRRIKQFPPQARRDAGGTRVTITQPSLL